MAAGFVKVISPANKKPVRIRASKTPGQLAAQIGRIHSKQFKGK